MAPYFLLLSIPSLLAVFHHRKTNIVLSVLIFVIFVGFIGLRYHVGKDWNNYEYIHFGILDYSFAEVVVHKEPLSYTLFWISSYLEQEMLLSNVVAAIILMLGVFSISLKTANPWLAIVAATPFLIIAFGMTGIRQAMSIGIVMIMFSRWEQTGMFKRSAFIGLASLFHLSAISTAIVFVMDPSVRLFRRLVLGAVMIPVMVFGVRYASSVSSSVSYYQRTYTVGSETMITSPGALLHVALVFGPAIVFLLFRKRMRAAVYNYNLLMFGSLATLAMIPVFFVSSVGAARLVLYLYFVPMMIYASIPDLFMRRARSFVIFIICMIHFAVLALWLNYANNSDAHVPYRNILFERGL